MGFFTHFIQYLKIKYAGAKKGGNEREEITITIHDENIVFKII